VRPCLGISLVKMELDSNLSDTVRLSVVRVDVMSGADIRWTYTDKYALYCHDANCC
jgi:hypothetical protein